MSGFQYELHTGRTLEYKGVHTEDANVITYCMISMRYDFFYNLVKSVL